MPKISDLPAAVLGDLTDTDLLCLVDIADLTTKKVAADLWRTFMDTGQAAVGTNIAAVDRTIAAPRSTGDAVPASLVFTVGALGTSGAAAQSAVAILRLRGSAASAAVGEMALSGFATTRLIPGSAGIAFRDSGNANDALTLNAAGTALAAPIATSVVLGADPGGSHLLRVGGGLILAASSLTNALQVTSTGAIQASVRYDTSNRLDVSVGLSGATTFTANGTGSGFTFLPTNATLALMTLGNDSGPSASFFLRSNSVASSLGMYLANATTGARLVRLSNGQGGGAFSVQFQDDGATLSNTGSRVYQIDRFGNDGADGHFFRLRDADSATFAVQSTSGGSSPTRFGVTRLFMAAYVPTIILGSDGSGTNVAASATTVRPALSTGNALPAALIFQVGVLGSSGAALQSLAEFMRLRGNAASATIGELVFGLATTRLVVPATTLAFRNNANSADLITLSGAGALAFPSITSFVVGADPGGADLFRVGGGGTFSGRVRVTANDQTQSRVQLSNTGTLGREYALVAGTPNVGQEGFSLHDVTANVTRLHVTATGNIGINTVTPGFKATILHSFPATFTNVATDYAMMILDDAPENWLGIAGQTTTDKWVGLITNGSPAPSLVLGTGGSERARITAGGYLKASNDGTYRGSTAAYHELRQSANATEIALLTHTGTNPYGPTLVFENAAPDNNTNWFLSLQDNVALRCIIYSDGDVLNHDGVYGTISDAKLKQDITPARSQWDDFRKLEFVNYRMIGDVDARGDSAPRLLGNVAQQVRAVSPGLVEGHTDEQGNETLSIKTSILFMKGMVVVQELQHRVESIEDQMLRVVSHFAAIGQPLPVT